MADCRPDRRRRGEAGTLDGVPSQPLPLGLHEDDSEALTFGRNPATYPALLAELESNCRRGGHVARMFEELMDDVALDYEPHGQDATPARNAREWLRLYGGRWVWSPIAGDSHAFGGWIPAPW